MMEKFFQTLCVSPLLQTLNSSLLSFIAGTKKEISELSNPYQMPGIPYLLMGEEKYAFFQNPYQAEIMSQAEFLNIDITFTQNELFPYILNIVAFDYLVLECK